MTDYRAEYARWLEDFADDKQTREELNSIAGDEKEIEDRFYTELAFGTGGMRGVLGAGLNRMNKYNIRRVTEALAKYIKSGPDQAERGVAIAYDSRRCSDVFAKEAALTLCAHGVKAYLFDSLRPVPVLSFTVRRLKTIAGIVITASHNPAKYNGYKVYWEDGGQMPPERADEIVKRIRDTPFTKNCAMTEQEALNQKLLTYIGADVDGAYTETVKKLCINPELAKEMGRTLSIVYTPLHGSGNLPVRRVLKEIGFENVHVVKEQELPDPDFPTVTVPNPEDPAAFKLALKLQEELNADVVFGTDPDCDRVGIAVKDNDGEVHILTGNQTGCLLLEYILSQKTVKKTLAKNAAVVKSIVSTEMARAICWAYGVKLYDVLTGFKFIAEMIEEFEKTGSGTFEFGFEESYGYLSGTEVRDKDGVNACMLIAETAAFYKKKGMTLYDALQALFEKYGYYGDKVASFTLAGKDGLEKMGSIMQALRDNPPTELGGTKVRAVRDYLTGLRTEDGESASTGLPKSNVLYFELSDGAWVCVRPSGTEPKIKLYVNAVSNEPEETEKKLSAYADAAVKLMESV